MSRFFAMVSCTAHSGNRKGGRGKAMMSCGVIKRTLPMGKEQSLLVDASIVHKQMLGEKKKKKQDKVRETFTRN